MLVGVFTLDNASDGFLVVRAHQLVVATRLLPLLWSALSLLRATATVPGGWAGAERCPDGADLAERVAAILGSDPFGAAPA